MDFPQVTHNYLNNTLDSTRWQEFETRPDDIIVTTAYKSGTTWMQTIVANLIFQGIDIPGAIMDISPWIDMRLRPFDEICETTAAQTHRRILKTHLALDGMLYKEDVKYIYVGRDLRDVFMSIWNHYSGHSELFFEVVNNPESLVGEPMPRCPEDIMDFWRDWISKSSFEWEADGYPYWSATHHAQTWWDYRHLPNILFVHFSDLLESPRAEIDRIAEFLDIPTSSTSLDTIVEAVSFKTMKENGENIMGEASGFWEGGANKFLYKGSNGRWHDVLSEKDLADYKAMIERSLSPDCAAWLEQGRAALN